MNVKTLTQNSNMAYQAVGPHNIPSLRHIYDGKVLK